MPPDIGSPPAQLPRRRPGRSDPGPFSRAPCPRRRPRLARTYSSPHLRSPAQRSAEPFGWFGRPATLLGVALALLLSGCSAGGSPQGPTVERAAAGDPLQLAGSCPARVVLQAAWYPTADLAVPFQLLGADRSVDAKRKRVSGSLVAGGKDTGVELEFRSGGPATGFQTAPAVMYADRSITLGFTNVDEILGLSAGQPMQAVIAPLNGDPQVLIWDPRTHPEFTGIADIGQTDTPIVHSANATTVFGYLTGSGILRARQLDASYDGSPSRFVASGGRVVVQGYATNEPYVYEHLPSWRRPVTYQLVQETGYPNYANVLAVRSGDRERLAPCLRKLVPILQQAQIDFMAEPAAALDRIVEAVEAFRAGFTYDRAAADFGVCQLRDLGLVSNSIAGVLGGFDPNKLDRMVDIVRPLLAAQRRPMRPGLSAADVATNDFVDPTKKLPVSSTRSPACPRRSGP